MERISPAKVGNTKMEGSVEMSQIKEALQAVSTSREVGNEYLKSPIQDFQEAVLELKALEAWEKIQAKRDTLLRQYIVNNIEQYGCGTAQASEGTIFTNGGYTKSTMVGNYL